MAAKNGKTQLSPKPKTQNTKTLHAENHTVCTERTAEEEEGARHEKTPATRPAFEERCIATKPQSSSVNVWASCLTSPSRRNVSVRSACWKQKGPGVRRPRGDKPRNFKLDGSPHFSLVFYLWFVSELMESEWLMKLWMNPCHWLVDDCLISTFAFECKKRFQSC